MFEQFTVNLSPKLVKRKKLEGRDHLVVPASMLAEGAWTGEFGTFYYPGDELKKSVRGWNHKPVVAYHPMTDGKAVSACDPDVLNTQKVGVILNTRYDETAKKLRSEVWIDVDRCTEIDPRIVAAINKNQLTEVSTGLNLSSDETEGVWVNAAGKKKKYQGTATDYEPDHLAILPDQIGAFTVSDGGGLLQVNAAGEVIGGVTNLLEDARRAAVKGPRALKKYLRAVFAANALSFSDIRGKLSDLLAAKYGEPGKSWYGEIVDIFPDYCVFCTNYRDGVMWRQGYTATDAAVALSGEAVKVVRSTEYVAANTAPAVPSVNQENSVEKKVMIDALIANSGEAFEEADRVDLEKWSDAKLKKHLAKYPKVEQTNTSPKDETKIVLTKAEYDDLVKAMQTVQQNTVPTLEESLKGLHPAIAKQLKKAHDREEGEKLLLINKLKEKAPKLNEARLKEMDVEELEGMAQLAGVGAEQHNTGREPLFIGNAGGGTDDAGEPETGLEIPDINWSQWSQQNNNSGRKKKVDVGDDE